MEKNRKKVGLALGGGGARGFCHIGVLQVLEENGIPIDIVTGCSIGSIVGGCYAAGMDPYYMSKVISKFSQIKIMDVDVTFKNQGIVKGNRAIAFIKKHIGDIDIGQCRVPFAATAVDAKKAELVTFTSGSLLNAIRASIAIPGYFQSVKCEEGDCLIDGGVLERIPIDSCKSLGADIVIAVDALGPPEPVEKINTFIDMLIRAYNIMDWGCSAEKIKAADVLITPNQPNKTILDFKNNPHSVTSGRVAAEAALPKIRELLA